MPQPERQQWADRLRATLAITRATLSEVAVASKVDQPFVSRFLNEFDYQFETDKVVRLMAYVIMQESTSGQQQLQLPFETTEALKRFLGAQGNLKMLNGLLDLLASYAH